MRSNCQAFEAAGALATPSERSFLLKLRARSSCLVQITDLCSPVVEKVIALR